ncbi:hypothetical protein GQ457_13G011370 [Hibiscus cannabinus]
MKYFLSQSFIVVAYLQAWIFDEFCELGSLRECFNSSIPTTLLIIIIIYADKKKCHVQEANRVQLIMMIMVGGGEKSLKVLVIMSNVNFVKELSRKE